MSSRYISRPSFEPLTDHMVLQRPSFESATPSFSYSSSSNSTPGGEEATGGNMEIRSRIFPYRFLDHVRLGGAKVSDRVKGKCKLGAMIIKKGGRKNIFKQVFEVGEGEKLLKASQCYLLTTAGLISGLLFISNEKLSFCSERLIISNIPIEHFSGTDEKVEMPLRNIRRPNLNEQQQECIKIVREDNTELLFVHFVCYENARKNLETAISMAESSRSSLF